MSHRDPTWIVLEEAEGLVAPLAQQAPDMPGGVIMVDLEFFT